MDNVVLICEVFIGLFGVYAIIIGDSAHERLHGLFVVGLALEGFIAHLLPEHRISSILVIILAVLAILMVIMNFHSFIRHMHRLFHHNKAKREGKIAKDAPLPKDGKEFNLFDSFEKIEKRLLAIEEKLENKALELEEWEKSLSEREKKISAEVESQIATSEDK